MKIEKISSAERSTLTKSYKLVNMSYKQLFILLCWDIFNDKKLNAFYYGLKIGKNLNLAFADAYNNYYDTI